MNGKKRLGGWGRRLLSAALSLLLAAGPVLSSTVTSAKAAGEGRLTLDNGYILAELTKRNGCFDIRTVNGDKVNKADNNKNLLFPSGDDATSFTSFQVTRGGQTKEYIFGGSYAGSSPVTVQQTANELIAVWSVDDLTFTQTISLVNSGSNEHGMVYLSYTVANAGQPAAIKFRILLDTALGSQDYAYYQVGTQQVETETALSADGYSKSFYCCDDPFNPKITAYLVNASLNDRECRPYRTVFAHWNNLAATAFDYTPDPGMTFTNFNNKQYLTADSACALYYDLGSVAQGASGAAALNYGVYSNEKATAAQTATVNVTAPDVMTLTADATAYAGDGKFTVQTAVKNIGTQTYQKARIVLYTTGLLKALDENGRDAGATYDAPYYREVYNFTPGQTQTITWNLQALPQADGVYASATFKVYNVSDEATQGTGTLVADNLMGEGSAWVLCPGTVDKMPQIQFTGSSPEVLYSSGNRMFYAVGKNFSMLTDTGDYSLMLSRVDGQAWNGKTAAAIPADKFHIDTEKNILTVSMDNDDPGELPEGQYQLTIDYTDTSREDLSAPALRFAVKQEEKYRNETYGLLAAVKSGSGPNSTYGIQSFANEEAYQKALNGTLSRDNALLEFRGIFNKRTDGGKTIYTGVSSGSGNNVMTLNSCLDFENGSVTITEQGGSVTVDFDASVYTTGARTSVWKGVAALTELEAGKDYGLIQYDESGDRDTKPVNTITLLWPSVGQAAQNLLGFLMEFKYGELGVIKHDGADETRVVAFGAAMDLSFIIPSFQETTDDQSLLGDAYNAAIHGGSGYPSAADIRALNERIPYDTDTVNTDVGPDGGTGEEEDDDNSISGSIQIDDVLFGGEFLGVNMAVSLAVPAYIEGTPSVEGTLTLKTVGDWAVGVEGSCDFSVFCMEGEIHIKSRNNIPVPDTIHFFLGDCTPGICLDPCGVLWIQGAGGGIEDLYDTIFLTDSIPPLKLILDAQFSLMQVISAKASLSLSLRGIGVTLSEGKVANMVPVLDTARLQVDWYPEFFFLSSVQMDVAGVIKGGGYIVVEQSGFFEFFVKASIQIPEDIEIIGGMEIASVGLGANAAKIWGQIKVLGVSLGIVYYWGGDVEWGGGAAAEPTYPELLSMSRAVYRDIPVYVDSATGRTLYACVGTNLKLSGDAGPDASGNTRAVQNKLTVNADDGTYTLELDQKVKDELLILEWPADSLEAARSDLKNFTIKDGTGAVKEIRLLDQTKPADGQPDANANLTFRMVKDEETGAETGTATLAVSFTDASEFGKAWTIKPPAISASVVLYDLEPIPELSNDRTTVKVEDGKMTVILDGTDLGEFDNVSFIAVEENSGSSGEAALLYKAEKQAGSSLDSTQTFELPVDLQSGTYELRIVANDENGQYHSEVSKSFNYTNSNAPAGPTGVTAACAGDYRLHVSANAPAGAFDGYRVNVYDASGAEVDGVSGLLFTRDGQPVRYNGDGTLVLPENNSAASAAMTVGGQYLLRPDENGEAGSKVETRGLLADETYRIGVSTWKQVKKGEGTVLLYSEEASDTVKMQARVETTISFRADVDYVEVTEQRDTGENEQITFTTPMYRQNSLKLTMTASPGVSGTWKLDGKELEVSGSTGTVTEQTLPLTDLAEGVHTLEFTGKNTNGDAARGVYTFGVDTLAPRLMLSSPVSGSFYDDTAGVTVQGITDQNVKLTIIDTATGATYGPDAVETDAEGRFAKAVNLAPGLAFHTLIVTVEDAVGNQTQKTVDLLSAALGDIVGLSIYSGQSNITNTSVLSGKEYPLVLMAELGNGGNLELNNATLVEWRQTAVDGDAVLAQEDGTYSLTAGKTAQGMVSAHFLVSDLGSVSASFAYGPGSETPDEPQPETPVRPMPGSTDDDDDDDDSTPGKKEPSAPVTKPSETAENPFVDVPAGTFYHDAVLWAVEQGITNGTTATTFSPEASCVRAQIATFLWRAAGSPAPVGGSDSFTDIQAGSYYYNAVLWAVEQGITNGTTKTAFSPGAPCTRAQIVTFLWRAAGSPAPVSGSNPFNDVQAGSYYYNAVLWAVEQGITNGTTATTFNPGAPCTRAQIVTFLWRAAGSPVPTSGVDPITDT